MTLTQLEYDFLISIEKTFEDTITPIQFGPAPIKWSRQINSIINKETFVLDFYRGSFELSKYTINKRYRQTVILLRYDNGGRHTNPDGEVFEGPHVHLYREGYDDKYAFPVSQLGIEHNDRIEVVFDKIMHFCNIINLPPREIPMF